MNKLPRNSITRRFENVISSSSSGIDPQVTKEDARKIRSLVKSSSAHQIIQDFETSEHCQTFMDIDSSDPEYVITL
jgi:hypothetical protein